MRTAFVVATSVLFLGASPLLYAQYQDISFEQVRLPGGSAANFVIGIDQDQQGFLWLATRRGLTRYDGYETKTYRHDPRDSTSLAQSKWVETVFVDQEGVLWVGTFGGGLDRFDPRTESFSHYRHDATNPNTLSGDTVTVILEDRMGALWVGTHQGLNRMDRETGTFTRFRHNPVDPTSLSNDQVRVLYEDRQGTLWVGTGSPWGNESPPGAGGLNRFDPETETFTRFLHDPYDKATLVDNHISALFEDSRGTFWVGTSSNGLHSMDRQQGTFTRHLYDPAVPSRLSGPFREQTVGPAYVSVVYEDSSRALWIGSIFGGLNHYDPGTGQLTRFQYLPGDPRMLRSDEVINVFESRERVLWIVTWNGLFKVVQQSPIRRHTLVGPSNGGTNHVKAILEDREGYLWVGTEADGLSRFDRSIIKRPGSRDIEPETKYLHDPYDPSSLSDNTVYSLLEDREGLLWVGTASGLDRIDRQTGRFTRYQHDPEDPYSLGAGPVLSIYEDREGVLWAGTYGGGLSRFDPKTGRTVRFLHDPTNANTLSDNDVAFVRGGREGTLWIGTVRGGLNHFNPRSGRFNRYSYNVSAPSGMSDGFLLCMYEDENGTVWIGTENGGLNRLDTRTGHFTHFTTANSDLPDDRINGILGDERGSIWIITGSALTRYDVQQDAFYSFNLDLITSTDIEPNAYHKGRSGAFFFGGENAFVLFNPEDVLRNTSRNNYPPEVAITGLSLDRQPIRPGAEGALDDSLWQSREIKIAHDHTVFSFEFVALHFKDPEKNRYAYMLENYDDAWREGGIRRQASFYKVPPGKYVFRVKVANSDGIWNEEGASIRVVVLPPWWRTTWAYVLYGLLFIAGVFAVDHFQRRRLIQREREKARERELEQAKEIEQAYRQLETAHNRLEQTHQHLKATQQQLIQQEKLASLGQLTAGIAHEIKNPLNFVNNFAATSNELAQEITEAARAGDFDEVLAIAADLRLTTSKVEEHGKRADGIVRSMLLHAKGANGERTTADLNALVEESVNLAYHSFRAQVPDFDCKLERSFDQSIGSVEMIPQEIGRVLLNLLGNAFYAVHEKATKFDGQYAPMVKVSTSRVGDQVEIRIEDNGPGIPESIREKIFEPFFTTKPTGQGTGLGLSLAYDIVAQGHGGKLEAEGMDGKGAVFTIKLPCTDTVTPGQKGESVRSSEMGVA